MVWLRPVLVLGYEGPPAESGSVGRSQLGLCGREPEGWKRPKQPVAVGQPDPGQPAFRTSPTANAAAEDRAGSRHQVT